MFIVAYFLHVFMRKIAPNKQTKKILIFSPLCTTSLTDIQEKGNCIQD